MRKRTRDETAEPVSRDQILRREMGQGNIHFPCSADHDICRRPDNHTCFCLFFSSFFSLEMPLFASIFCTTAVFSLYGEYVICFFLSRIVFFYLVATGWIFYTAYVRIQPINQSVSSQSCSWSAEQGD